MRLKIDFHYHVSYRFFQQQNERRAVLEASTEVEIPEAAPGSAPVAFMVGNPKGKGPKSFSMKKDGSMREVRSHSGRLFVEVGPVAELVEKANGALNATPFSGCHAWHDQKDEQRYSDRDDGYRENSNNVTTVERLRAHSFKQFKRDFQTISDDGGAKKEQDLKRRAADLLLVDGTLYQLTAEPILKIGQFDREATVSPRPSLREEYYYDAHDTYAGHTFGGDMHEALAQSGPLLQSERKRKGDPDEEEDKVTGRPSFEVLDPSLSTFDGTAYDAAKSAKEAYNILWRDAAMLDREGLAAFYALRAALKEDQDEMTPAVAEALERVAEIKDPDRTKAALIAAHHHTKRSPYDRGQGANFAARLADKSANTSSSARSAAMKCLRRWSLRPVGPGLSAEALAVTGEPARKPGDSWSRQVLSIGKLKDLCKRIGVEPGPAIEAFRSGKPVLAVGTGGSPAALVIVGSDGAQEVLSRDKPMPSWTDAAERHLMKAERAVDAMFDILPVTNPVA